MVKEQIISKLKTQIKNLNNMKIEIESQISNMEETISILQDESKLGTASNFDFGKTEQKKEINKIEKTVKKGISELKKTQKETEELQNQGEIYTASKIDDSIEKE